MPPAAEYERDGYLLLYEAESGWVVPRVGLIASFHVVC